MSSTDETELIELQMLAPSNDFDGLFDQIEVWRSTETSDGPYVELTALGQQPARIPSTAGDAPTTPIDGRSVAIVGLTLELRLNGTEDLLMTFSGTSPLTYQQAAQLLTTQAQGKITAHVDSDGVFVVQTIAMGTAATLEVMGGSAVAALGLSIYAPDNSSFGREARIGIIPGQTVYSFQDHHGSKEYYYKTRFRNRHLGTTSEFSQPFQAGQSLGITGSNVVTGLVSLVQGDGRPLSGQEVRVYNDTQTTLVEGKLVTGLHQAKITDSTGSASFALVRGVRYTVAVMGTSIVRKIIAPTSASISSFDLFSSTVADQADNFVAQVPNIIVAERRSL